MENLIAVILAAGKDVNMKSKKSKLVQKIYGKELIKRVAESTIRAGVDSIITVVGENAQDIKDVLQNTSKYVEQKEALGTGDAVKQVKDLLKNKKGKVLILNGDVPLITAKTLRKLIEKSINDKDYGTVLTAMYNSPKGYGRIIRNETGVLENIVEDFETNVEQAKIKEINAGIYCFDIEKMIELIDQLEEHDDGLIYINDMIKLMKENNLKVDALIAEDNTEVLGVNDRLQLEMLTNILRIKINQYHMLNGVTIEDMNNTYIYEDVKIGMDTVIHPNTTIKSDVIIGEDCEIGPNAFIREGCRLSNKVKVGNCVEIKKTIVGEGTKVPHLTYMGDCTIGGGSNIGCGTITCNYDGVNKHKTIIGNNAFIGSNTNLVAPVTLGDNVLVAAGSTITNDVPSDTLAIARQRQTNKEGWVSSHPKTKKK